MIFALQKGVIPMDPDKEALFHALVSPAAKGLRERYFETISILTAKDKKIYFKEEKIWIFHR